MPSTHRRTLSAPSELTLCSLLSPPSRAPTPLTPTSMSSPNWSRNPTRRTTCANSWSTSSPAHGRASCKHHSLLEDRKQPGRFLTFETWTDQAALDAQMKTPAIQAAGPKLQPILAQPFTQQFLSMVTDG